MRSWVRIFPEAIPLCIGYRKLVGNRIPNLATICSNDINFSYALVAKRVHVHSLEVTVTIIGLSVRSGRSCAVVITVMSVSGC